MGKILGLGGIFFKAKDPQKLLQWYQKTLNMLDPAENLPIFQLENYPRTAYTLMSPFSKDSNYFEPSDKDFMINLVVEQIEEIVEQLKNNNVEVSEIIENIHGKFCSFLDPEDNKIELWEPPTKKII